MADTYITDEMRASIGREYARRVSPPVDPTLIRIWAIAIRWPEPPDRIHWDEDYARTTKYGGIVAPHFFNPFAYQINERRATRPWSFGGGDGPGRRDLRVLNGGGETEYFDVPIRPGDVITESQSVVDMYEREGRMGRMLFTVTETRWTNQNNELVRLYRGTIINY